MPRAEAGTTKAIANSMKAKGLQRLRWYCSACSQQMRDENGFKCHVASEKHQRNILTLGEDPRRVINEFSQQFQRDFIQLLRTGHGEKKINANRFYNEYISNKEHVHMNATKWTSLTEFVKHLGREGIVRVDVDEKNEERGGASALMISWVDNSPEALRRQEALRKRERQDRGDEDREQRLIREQIRRAREAAGEMVDDEVETSEVPSDEPQIQGIKRVDGEKIRLNLGMKKDEASKLPSPPLTDDTTGPESEVNTRNAPSSEQQEKVQPAKISLQPLSIAGSKPKNVFAAAAAVKKNVFSSVKRSVVSVPSKPMSEAERIMKEELERKRRREDSSHFDVKRPRH